MTYPPRQLLKSWLHLIAEEQRRMEKHPLYEKFARECPDAPQKVRWLSFQVYLDVVLAKEWANVHAKFCKSLEKIVLLARRELEEEAEIIVPMTEAESWSVSSVSILFSELFEMSLEPSSDLERSMLAFSHPGEKELTLYHSLVLAVMSTDSTVVYYRIYNGLVPPEEEKER
ncbi:hypothetical protein SpCBS45565_g00769 [Spizellomyces sp. 'palustris']|nr:hypothetical protein SpCBS45565_g00769 [Spizellomyces sp. 'palustris']